MINKAARQHFNMGGFGVADHNCTVGQAASRIRKRQAKADYANYIYGDRVKYINTNKKNPEGMRR